MADDKDSNKHGEVTAKSFERLAKGCRAEARQYPKSTPRAQDWRKLGAMLDAEAAFVRKKP